MATIRIHRGKWQAIVRRVGCQQKSKSFISKAHAVKWARHIETHLDMGIMQADTRILDQTSVSDLLVRYRDTVTINKKGNASEATRINSFLKQTWAPQKLNKVTSGIFSHYRDNRLKVVKPATVRRDLGLLRAIFEVAIKEWDFPLTSNPLSNVKKPKEPNSRDRRLMPGEKELLLKAAESHTGTWLAAGIHLAMETAMRRGELLSVTWGDVSLLTATLLIRDTKNGHPRTIPLSKIAVETLSSMRHINEQAEGKVFSITANAFQIAWQRCKKRVAIDHPDISTLRFHDLRHEAISRFFEIGLTIPEVALISGHRDPRMLFKYTHLRAEDIVPKINAKAHHYS